MRNITTQEMSEHAIIIIIIECIRYHTQQPQHYQTWNLHSLYYRWLIGLTYYNYSDKRPSQQPEKNQECVPHSKPVEQTKPQICTSGLWKRMWLPMMPKSTMCGPR